MVIVLHDYQYDAEVCLKYLIPHANKESPTRNLGLKLVSRI